MSLHIARRRWWAPWRLVCACGAGWYPCPDTGRVPYAPLGDGTTTPARPAWTSAATTRILPNVRLSPLLTRGQAYRTRQGGRW